MLNYNAYSASNNNTSGSSNSTVNRHMQPFQNNPGDSGSSVNKSFNGLVQPLGSNPSLTVVKSNNPKPSPTPSSASDLASSDPPKQNLTNSANALKESLLISTMYKPDTYNDKMKSPEPVNPEKCQIIDKRMAITKAFDTLSRAANKTVAAGLVPEETDLNTQLKLEKKHHADLECGRLLKEEKDAEFSIQPSHSVPFTENFVLQMASRLLLHSFDWIKNSNSAFTSLE